MKNWKFKISSGQEVLLSEDDMLMIHQHFELQCTADYLRENNPDWPEEKVQMIASETRRQIDKYGLDEEDAIESAKDDYIERIK